eukprot:SM000610S19830  [mRNA]  locus=s610:1731:2144:+ [translate_table: standard]
MTGNLGQVARQVAGWLARQVACQEVLLARIHPFKGGSLARRNAGHGATRSHPWKGSPPHPAAGLAAPACAQEVESPLDGGATGPGLSSAAPVL